MSQEDWNEFAKSIGYPERLGYRHRQTNHAPYQEMYTSHTKDLVYQFYKQDIKTFGYKFALGGIFSIKAKDFEKLQGFPNFETHGYEDTILKKKSDYYNMNINAISIDFYFAHQCR